MSYKLNPVAGVDVAKNFSEIQIIDASSKPYGNPIHMEHTHQKMVAALKKVQRAQKELDDRIAIVMEATGHYFRIVFYLFYNAGFDVAVVNPIQTKAFANAPKIRRATTDKISAKDLALLYRLGQLTPTKIPTATRVKLRDMERDYWRFKKQIHGWKMRFNAIRDQVFLLYEKAFDDMFSPTALSIFIDYPTPELLLNEDPDILVAKLRKRARKSQKWAEYKARLLIALAQESPSIPQDRKMLVKRLQSHAATIEFLINQANSLLKDIEKLIRDDREYKLLLTIPGVGPIVAATILAELGETSWFKKSKEIVAFAGIDPVVKKSGKFEKVEVHMSKKGSHYLRLALFIAASSAILSKRNGKSPNPVLRAYYSKLIGKGKTHKAAIGACMRKMAEYIFAVLRDGKPFEIRYPLKPSEKEQTCTNCQPEKDDENPFPVYDENGRVMSYATDPVPVRTVLHRVMKRIERQQRR